jgi:hypothetical protein
VSILLAMLIFVQHTIESSEALEVINNRAKKMTLDLPQEMRIKDVLTILNIIVIQPPLQPISPQILGVAIMKLA